MRQGASIWWTRLDLSQGGHKQGNQILGGQKVSETLIFLKGNLMTPRRWETLPFLPFSPSSRSQTLDPFNLNFNDPQL